MIHLNGLSIELNSPTSLSNLLEAQNIDLLGVAVARNETIVSRAAWESTLINDGDRIEVITAMQGG
ncbi:MAG: sulfur carrier protein ThiS [Ferrimicrobium sp.]